MSTNYLPLNTLLPAIVAYVVGDDAYIAGL